MRRRPGPLPPAFRAERDRASVHLGKTHTSVGSARTRASHLRTSSGTTSLSLWPLSRCSTSRRRTSTMARMLRSPSRLNMTTCEAHTAEFDFRFGAWCLARPPSTQCPSPVHKRHGRTGRGKDVRAGRLARGHPSVLGRARVPSVLGRARAPSVLVRPMAFARATDLVDAVDKLGREGLLHGCHHAGAHRLRDRAIAALGKLGRPDVGGHDDDRVAEVDLGTARIDAFCQQRVRGRAIADRVSLSLVRGPCGRL